MEIYDNFPSLADFLKERTDFLSWSISLLRLLSLNSRQLALQQDKHELIMTYDNVLDL